MNIIQHVLDYIAAQENAVLTCHVCDMVLAVHSNLGYNNMSKARNRARGHLFISNNENIPPPNGSRLNITQIINSYPAMVIYIYNHYYRSTIA